MITRSCCSSWTRSIILRSMQDLRSNPQGAGNPNIPRSCTALLQSSQSAAPGTSVYHTHTPARPWVRGVKGSAEFLWGGGRGWGEGEAAATSCGGIPTHSPNKKHRGSQCRVRKGIDNSSDENQIIPNQTGRVGENKIDWHRKLSWKSQWKCNLDFHFKRFEVSGTHLFICTPVWPSQTEIILKLNIQRNSHFLYLLVEIPRKRGSCLLVSYYIFFLFTLANFLVIVFHCKCKRPAVISLKVENRKERAKDSVGEYCKVDTVQRHKADSRKLQGTGELLHLSLPGLLHRSGDKGCSGSLSSARSANRRRFPVPWMFLLFEEKAATEKSEQC